MTAAHASSETRGAVRIAALSKRFGATTVLKDIALELRVGEVHAIVGENGAGKSTLGKIIGGYYAPDTGLIELFGKPVTSWSPRHALSQGVAMIHQELQLVPQLSVADNVFLGIEESAFGVMGRSAVPRFDALNRRCGFALNANDKVGALRIAERQKVEILRAIARDARIIVMDEPTSSLTDDEAAALHGVIARLKADGATVIYITHFLDHVLAVADRVTVMRDGTIVQTDLVANATKASLVEAMLGEPVDVAFPALPPAPKADVLPLLELRGVSTDTGVADVSLAVRPGEIVGLAGLVGSGRSEVARAIFGVDRIVAGEIRVAGKSLKNISPSTMIAQGVTLVPEDRRKQGLVLTQSTRANIALPHLGRLSRWGIVRRSEEARRCKTLIEHLDIRPRTTEGNVALYSGGNQQKVLLAKWMFGAPRVVILDEPSRGVDIGARRRIHDLIVELAEAGTAVLLISSEIEEVMGMSHRCTLMSSGRIVSSVDPRATSVGDVLHQLFAAGHEAQRRSAAV